MRRVLCLFAAAALSSSTFSQALAREPSQRDTSDRRSQAADARRELREAIRLSNPDAPARRYKRSKPDGAQTPKVQKGSATLKVDAEL